MPSGGYRKPSTPAAVSGPGKFSQRTDGRPGTQAARPVTGMPYGENQELNEIQGSAPLADSSGLPRPGGGGEGGFAMPDVTGFGEPSQRPDEPVTEGSPTGEGAGIEAMGFGSNQPPPEIAALKKYLPLLAPIANRADMPDSVRQLYLFIRDVPDQQMGV